MYKWLKVYAHRECAGLRACIYSALCAQTRACAHENALCKQNYMFSVYSKAPLCVTQVVNTGGIRYVNIAERYPSVFTGSSLALNTQTLFVYLKFIWDRTNHPDRYLIPLFLFLVFYLHITWLKCVHSCVYCAASMLVCLKDMLLM